MGMFSLITQLLFHARNAQQQGDNSPCVEICTDTPKNNPNSQTTQQPGSFAPGMQAPVCNCAAPGMPGSGFTPGTYPGIPGMPGTVPGTVPGTTVPYVPYVPQPPPVVVPAVPQPPQPSVSLTTTTTTTEVCTNQTVVNCESVPVETVETVIVPAEPTTPPTTPVMPSVTPMVPAVQPMVPSVLPPQPAVPMLPGGTPVSPTGQPLVPVAPSTVTGYAPTTGSGHSDCISNCFSTTKQTKPVTINPNSSNPSSNGSNPSCACAPSSGGMGSNNNFNPAPTPCVPTNPQNEFGDCLTASSMNLTTIGTVALPTYNTEPVQNSTCTC